MIDWGEVANSALIGGIIGGAIGGGYMAIRALIKWVKAGEVRKDDQQK